MRSARLNLIVLLLIGCAQADEEPARSEPVVRLGGATCPLTHSDCDGDPSNGCEVATDNDPANCGTCGFVCATPNSDTKCVTGFCVVDRCSPGFLDCDGDSENGCEVDGASDPDNCGACGSTCGEAPCAEGHCGTPPETLAMDQPRPTGIALREGNLLFACKGRSENPVARPGDIRRMPASGVNVQILASGLAEPWGFDADERNIYWTAFGTPEGTSADGSVRRMPLSGGAPVLLADGQRGPFAIVANGTAAHWSAMNEGALYRAAVDGGVHLLAAAAGPSYVAIARDKLLWTGGTAGRGVLGSVDLATRTSTVLLDDLASPLGVAADDEAVYWVSKGTEANEYRDGAVLKLPWGASAPTVLAAKQHDPRRIALGPDAVYWTCTGDGAVRAVAKAGGRVRTLAAHQGGPRALVVDATRVYWVNLDDGRIMAAAR